MLRLFVLVLIGVWAGACGLRDDSAPPPPTVARQSGALATQLWQSGATSNSFTVSWNFVPWYSPVMRVDLYLDGGTSPTTVCDVLASGPTGACESGSYTFTGYSSCSAHTVEASLCAFDDRNCFWGNAGDAWTAVSTVGASTSASPAALANGPTDFGSANRWLYTGTSALQTVPDASVLHDDSLAVVRGKVLTREGTPVVCGRVSVAGHAEYGAATTLWDGSFALAVNGTSPLLIDVQGPASSSFLPLQRRVVPRVHDYTWIDEARLTGYSGTGTLIDGSNRFALGAVESDYGVATRQLAAYFPTGTVATVDGVDYTSFSVRLVEYTVGPGGPAAMPGALPPSTGYTFAANFELAGHERKKVAFNQPVVLYVDSFAGIATGTGIPNGSYDEALGIWKPEPTGAVIEITNVSGGVATVAGVSGLSGGELSALARYPVGRRLWRLPVTHFSSFDWNFALRAIAGAVEPGLIKFFSEVTARPSCRSGSIVECENQTLGELLPIAGTPYSLFYSSARQPGRSRLMRASLEKPSGAPILRVEATATIAGQVLTPTAPVSEEVRDGKTYYTVGFRWDGRDLAGRVLSGRQRAHIKLGFVYESKYFTVTTFGDPAAMVTSPALSFASDSTRKEATLYRETEAWVDAWSDSIQGLGGWSLGPVHYYDAESQALYRGDGGVVYAERRDAAVDTVAGGGGAALASGANARSVYLPYAQSALAFGPDRSLYLATESNGVWQIAPDVADLVDGFKNAKMFLVASVPSTKGLAVDADGRILYSSSDHRVYRYDSKSGITTAIAGTGTGSAGLDDILAVNSALKNPRDLAVAADGTILVVDQGNARVRRITPTGFIRTVAGGGSTTTSGAKATDLYFTNINGIAVRANGDLFVATESEIWRVAPDGYATLVAGSGSSAAEDGVAATSATFNAIRGLSVSPDGTLHFTHWNPKCRVYRLEADAVLRVVAGTGACDVTDVPDGGRAVDSRLDGPAPIAINSRGELFIGNQGENFEDKKETRRIVRVAPGLPSTLVGSERYVPSQDGTEVYVFNARGIIQRTLDAFTGRSRLTFQHDPADPTKLTSIVDASGNALTVNRLSSTRVDLVSADLLATKLTLSGGYLTQLEDPASRLSTFTYSPAGLLLEYRDVIAVATGGLPYTFLYDEYGRLTSDRHPMTAGSGLNLSRASDPLGWRVTVTSPEGRQVSHDIRTDSAGALTRSNIVDYWGTELVTATTEDPSGKSVHTSYANGASATWMLKPDPRFGQLASYVSQLNYKSSPTASTVSSLVNRTVEPAVATLPGSADTLTDAYSWSDSGTSRNATVVTSKLSAGSLVRTVSPSGATQELEYDDHERLVRVGVAGLADVRIGYDSRGRATALQQGSCPALGSPQAGVDCASGPAPMPSGCRRVSIGYDSARGYFACAFDSIGLLTRVASDQIGRPTSIEAPFGSSTASPSFRTVSISYNNNGTTTVVVPVSVAGATTATHIFRIDRTSRKLEYEAPTIPDGPTKPSLTLGTDLEPLQFDPVEPWAQTIFGWDSVILRPYWRQFGSSSGGAGFFGDYLTFQPDGRPQYASRYRNFWSEEQAYSIYGFDGTLPNATYNHFLTSTGGDIWADISRSFDDRLRVSTQTLNVNATSSIAGFTYNPDGLVRTATISGTSITIDRLNGDGVTPRGDGEPSKTTSGSLTEQFVRSEFGEVAGSRDGAGNVLTWGYEAKFGASRLLGFTYDRDARGRITRVTETIAGAGLPARTQTTRYTYRHDGALEGVVVSADVSGSTPLRSTTYDYDVNGNRDVPGNVYDAQDRLVLVPYNGLTNDRDGRLTHDYYSLFFHRFDADGQLTEWEWADWIYSPRKTVRYRHDAYGRRVLREEEGVAGSTSYVYEDGGLLPIAEYRGGTLVSRFVFASRANVPDLVLQNGSVFRVFADHLGSPRLIVNAATGTVVQRSDYDEWGNVTEWIDPTFSPLPFGFAGGLYDRRSKLLHFGARDYDPARGRWLTKDPSGFGGADTNFYVYAHNDPVNFVDADGHMPMAAPIPVHVRLGTAALGGLVAGGFNYLNQKSSGHGNINERALWIAVGAGALQGFISPGTSIEQAVKLGFWVGFGQSLATDLTANCTPTPAFGKVALDAFAGGVFGAAGGWVGAKGEAALRISFASRVSPRLHAGDQLYRFLSVRPIAFGLAGGGAAALPVGDWITNAMEESLGK